MIDQDLIIFTKPKEKKFFMKRLTIVVVIFFMTVFLANVINVIDAADNLPDHNNKKRSPNFVIIIGDDSTYLD
jgi:hypothetical protein